MSADSVDTLNGRIKPDAKNSQRPCRKCLLQDVPGDAYFQELTEQIAMMDPDVRVDDQVYQFRLKQCRNCDRLLAGMCRVCGCYVEWRAAFRIKGCPLVHPKWMAEESLS